MAISGDWVWITFRIPQVLASKPIFASVNPMSAMTSRASLGTSRMALVVISPATMQIPVVTSVSQATRLVGSTASAASRTASEIWSAILSG